jgi:DNA modification methylase
VTKDLNSPNEAQNACLQDVLGTPTPRIIRRDPDDVRPNCRNARTHSKRQIRQVANSILANGFIGVIVIDEADMVLAGHARLEASKMLKLKLIPTLKVTGLSDAQKRAFALADNKIAANAGWDFEMLRTEFGELAEILPKLNLDLTITGFEPAEIDNIFADLDDAKADPADILPSPNDNAVTRLGDLWMLGAHRLKCSDARRRVDLDHLMGSACARMAFLDVPYNVRVAQVQGRGRTKHPEFAYASGEMSPSEYIAFLKEGLGNAVRVSIDGAVHYVCTDWRHFSELTAAGRAVYGGMLNLVVWAKTTPGQGSFYRSQHELIGVFRVGNTSHQNNIELGRFGRNRSNLWTYPGVNSFGASRMELLAAHPTVKPVALIADAMRDCTTKGDVVLDTFVGSGSTILAAEKVGRRGYGLECEPRYVDVSIRRWEAYTKSEAILDGDGRTFAEIQAERLAPGIAGKSPPATATDAPKPASPLADTTNDGNGDWVALGGETWGIPPDGGAK